jgi:hypothetical protein
MSQERLTLRKIREILRLKEEVGLSNRAIARASKMSNSTVGEYLRRAHVANLGWPLPEWISEEELYRRLFPKDAQADEPERPLPDWEYIQSELKKKSVTLKLLWIEYQGKHQDQHYKYTQFCEYYRRWAKSQAPSARFPHKGGEVMEVDYAGLIMTLVDPENGTTSQGPVFVATLPASDYIFAEVQPSPARRGRSCFHVGIRKQFAANCGCVDRCSTTNCPTRSVKPGRQGTVGLSGKVNHARKHSTMAHPRRRIVYQ